MGGCVEVQKRGDLKRPAFSLQGVGILRVQSTIIREILPTFVAGGGVWEGIRDENTRLGKKGKMTLLP